MMKVVIKDKNYFFVKGIELIINKTFPDRNVECHYHLNSRNVEGADLIILNVPAGVLYLSVPALQYRKEGCILIVITKESLFVNTRAFASCFQDAHFINKAAKISAVVALLKDAFNRPLVKKQENCMILHRRFITPLQHSIAKLTFSGLTIKEISKINGMKIRTVDYNKMRIKKNFNLKSNQELFEFLDFIYTENLQVEYR